MSPFAGGHDGRDGGSCPQLFDDLTANLALELIEAKSFEAGVVVLRYQTVLP